MHGLVQEVRKSSVCIKGLPVKWKDTQKDAFSREPEVGVVTAKTTRYHTNSTQVPLQKVKKQKALTVICTIIQQSLQISYKLTKYSSSQFTQLVPLTIHKKGKCNFGFDSVTSTILKE